MSPKKTRERSASPRQKARLVLDQLTQVRALAHPVRVRIVEALRDESLSPMQVAHRLGARPTSLYHHFQQLERAGLIKVAAVRQRRGATERLYRLVARELVVDRRVFSSPAGRRQRTAGVLQVASLMFSATLEDLQESARAGTLPLEDRDRVEFGTARLRIERRRLPVLMRKVRAVLEAAQREDAGERGEESIRLTLALFPVAATGLPTSESFAAGAGVASPVPGSRPVVAAAARGSAVRRGGRARSAAVVR